MNDNIVTLQSNAGQALAVVRNPAEHLQKWWVGGNFYEGGMLEYIRRHHSGGTFIDCGSCIGNHTLFFAKFCAERVLSIEPVRSSFRHQREVLELNDLLDKVIMCNTALGEKPGRGKMVHFAPKGHVNAGMWRLETKQANGVDVATLDYLVAHHGLDDVALVKIDVEYSEVAVLRGAAGLLEAQHPALFVELTDEGNRREAREFLRRFGYEQRSQHNRSPTFEFIVPPPRPEAEPPPPAKPRKVKVGAPGMVQLHYLGRNVGVEMYWGDATGQRYEFGNFVDRRRDYRCGYVDKRDVPGLLAKRDHGRPVFEKVG